MLELTNISKTFAGHQALADVNFAVRDGEFFSLLGPSGCGKTTLLRLISGLDLPTAGSIKYKGQDLTGLSANRRPFNTVFQNYALFPHLSVRQNIEFGLKLAKVSEAEIQKRVSEALDLVKLPRLANRAIANLSGGEKQRVALARALVNQPKVLLLDEPLSALDLKLRVQMRRELIEIQRRIGMTFIFVTHDQEEAMAMSDRIAVLDKGVIAQIDTPAAIYHEPANLFVAGFLGEMNVLEVEQGQAGTALVAGAFTVPNHPGAGYKLIVRPESIDIGHQIGSDKPTVPHLCANGIIVQMAFRGAATDFVVEVGGGARVLISRNSQNGSEFKVADRVQLRLAEYRYIGSAH
jgi:ABC-type Fe3+/spermidine/putrescine transport system ATPase subunit